MIDGLGLNDRLRVAIDLGKPFIVLDTYILVLLRIRGLQCHALVPEIANSVGPTRAKIFVYATE